MRGQKGRSEREQARPSRVTVHVEYWFYRTLPVSALAASEVVYVNLAV